MIERAHIKLSDLTKQIEDVLNKSFNLTNYWIVSEISGHKFYENKNRHYFEFIEKSEDINEPVAKVTGVAWSNGSRQIKSFELLTGQKFTNGIQVLVQVKIEYKSAYGLKLILMDIDPSFTLGNLEKNRRETLSRLVIENPSIIQLINEGYYTKNKKLDLPEAILSIAIIGSPNSEGYHDFIHTIQSNSFNYKFTIDVYQSSVQGANVEKELVSKLISIFQSSVTYDCVVIIRGGGAKTDFVVFDNYKVALAVAKFPVPIITGIGHHKDVSIVDLMAHSSTKTPTKAAEFIIAHNRKLDDKLFEIQKSIVIKVQQTATTFRASISNIKITLMNKSKIILTDKKQWISRFNQVIVNGSVTSLHTYHNGLNNLKHSIRNKYLSSIYSFNQQLSIANNSIINSSRKLFFSSHSKLNTLSNQLILRPKIITVNKTTELNNLIRNLSVNTKKYMVNKKGYLGHYVSVIKLLRPDNILKRGFAIIYKEDNVIIDISNVQVNDELKIELFNQEIMTKVKSKKKYD